LKASLLSLLICTFCRGRFQLRARHRDGTEILKGVLRCQGCGVEYPVTRGIPRMIVKPLSADQKATADAFGYEWTHYSELTDGDQREFLDWISPLTPADFEQRTVLDVGCGKGRHIFLAAQFGARIVVGVDLSSAVEVAYRNTYALPNVHVIQADVHNLPFADSFDLAYSIGVLHHLPVPKEGFLSMTKHVKSGGLVSSWVYGREGNRWIEKLVDPLRKHITSRLPLSVTRCLSFLPAIILYAALKLLYRPANNRQRFKRLLPYSAYLCSISDYSFAENFWNVFDQLVAPTAFYHSQEDIIDWYREADMQDVQVSRHHGNSWRASGFVAANALRTSRAGTSGVECCP
jgi:SAM-dependent methyltransferase